jgi:hypothetical protein
MLSMNKISPPTEVQAKPVTTPGTSIISEKFFSLKTFIGVMALRKKTKTY